jgi:hypothetical protein
MNNLEKLIDEETESSEANPDAPLPEGAKVIRPNQARSKVYSIRLNSAEVAAVQAIADAAQLPASTLVRSWIVEIVRSERGEISDAEAELRAAQAHLSQLQRHLAGNSS